MALRLGLGGPHKVLPLQRRLQGSFVGHVLQGLRNREDLETWGFLLRNLHGGEVLRGSSQDGVLQLPQGSVLRGRDGHVRHVRQRVIPILPRADFLQQVLGREVREDFRGYDLGQLQGG